MVKPAVWSDAERKEWWYDEDGEINKLGCGVLDYPKNSEIELFNGYEPDCLLMWLSSGISEIPGERTLPEELIQPEATCVREGTVEKMDHYPWMAPGSAPVFSPCGAMGGNPYGCADGSGTNFGDICPCEGVDVAEEKMCNTFTFGGLAEEYDWPNAPVTEWKAGTIEEVIWYATFGNHAGGYSYRLCKTPEGGISELTEECFQSGHLNFVGDKQLVEYHIDRLSGYKTELVAKQTTEGTFPAGSMWRANPIIPDENEPPVGSEDYSSGHVIDNIQIPSGLEPGDYVLSFRWDSKCVPEVFSFCSNIRITN